MITIDQLIERLHWMKVAKVTADIVSINTFPDDYIEFNFADGTNAEIILPANATTEKNNDRKSTTTSN